MELIEAKIYSIKNLDLIYTYAIDGDIKDESKYIGTKVVYENNKILDLNYKDKYFKEFIERIIKVYNKEKDEREIILLGKLTKDLIKNTELENDNKENYQSKGIPYFNATVKDLDFYTEYLKEAISIILQLYKNYEVININSIKGYNHKYIVDFNVSSLNKQLPIIISATDNNLNFKINRLDNTKINVEGNITSSAGVVKTTFNSLDKRVKASISYDATRKESTRKILIDNKEVYVDNNKNILTEEDLNIIDFYLKMNNIEIPKNILKTSNNTYLLTEQNSLNKKTEEVLLENKHIELKVDEDKVNIKYIINNNFSKYKNMMQVKLDEERTDITLRKINEYDNYILIENCTTKNNKKEYSYKIIKCNKNVSLNKEFNIIEKHTIDKEVKTVNDAFKYIKTKGEIK